MRIDCKQQLKWNGVGETTTHFELRHELRRRKCQISLKQIFLRKFKEITFLQRNSDGESIYYHGPHESWNPTDGLQKLNNSILNFYLYLPKENKERKTCQGCRETSLDLLSTCLLVIEFGFDAMLCSNLGNVNSDAAMLNVHVSCRFRTLGVIRYLHFAVLLRF